MKGSAFNYDTYTSIGSILIRNGHLTDRQLEKAIKSQGNGRSGMLIGDIVVAMGFCSKDDVEDAFRHQSVVRTPESRSDVAVARLFAVADSADGAVDKLRTTTKTFRKVDISTGDE